MHIGIDGGGIAFDDGAVGNCECCGGDPCPDGICAYPTMDVTLSWTDADVTKTYLGKTFTSGQTHEICPTAYDCARIAPYTTSRSLFFYSTSISPYGVYSPVNITASSMKESWLFNDTENAYTQNRVTYKRKKINQTSTTTTTINYNPNTTDAIGRRLWMAVGRKKNLAPSFETNTWRGSIQMNFGVPNTGTADTTSMWGRHSNFERGVNRVGTPSAYATYGSTTSYWTYKAPEIYYTPRIQATTKNFLTSDFDGTFTTGRGITITWARKLSSPCSSLTWGAC